MNNKTKKTIVIVTVALALILAGLAIAMYYHPQKFAENVSEPNIVYPVPVNINTESLADGIYPVAFGKDNVRKAEGGCEIQFEVFNMDLYDTVELHQMQTGDFILIGGELVKVDSLSVDGPVIINGGLDYGGAELIPVGGGVYRYRGWDDIATYTSCGSVTLFVPDTVDFIDKGNVRDSMEGVVVPGAKVYEYLKSVDFGSFDEFSVRIRIEDGRVVEFYRNYMP